MAAPLILRNTLRNLPSHAFTAPSPKSAFGHIPDGVSKELKTFATTSPTHRHAAAAIWLCTKGSPILDLFRCDPKVPPLTTLPSGRVWKSLEGSLPHVTVLDLSGNALHTLPEELFLTLHGLRIVRVAYNCLSSLPSSLGKLKELRELDVSYNCIREFPSLLALPHLRTVVMQSNLCHPGDVAEELPEGVVVTPTPEALI